MTICDKNRRLATSVRRNNSALNYTEKRTYGPYVSLGLDLNVDVSEELCQ